ncbi:hypothetical protein [Mycobacterium sp. SA01]|uniref:hypothetical protein n=1 Tax=Mycobacterium sp. SA01 TaxID=3238820 RepID=UPI00351BAE5F
MSVDWSAIAAWGALALSLGNTAHTVRKETRKPITERQQNLRDDLRSILKAAQDDIRPVVKQLQSGSVPAGGLPDSVAKLRDRLDAVVQDGITIPHESHVAAVQTRYSGLDADWARLQNAHERVVNYAPDGFYKLEELTQRRTASSMELLRKLEALLKRVDKLIEALSKIDNGDKTTIKKYSKHEMWL